MTITRHAFDEQALESLTGRLGSDQQAHWRRDRSAYTPEVFTSTVGDVRVSALVTARPHTAAHKIADLLLASASEARPEVEATSAALRELLTAVIKAHPDDAATRIEVNPWLCSTVEGYRGVLEQLGFAASRAPLPSIPSTTEGIGAWVRWASAPQPSAAPMPPYLGQTTDFTCGAVSLITALHRDGRPLLADATDRGSNQHDELRWWRKATNMPACDPLTLAIAGAEALGHAATPTVYLTDPEPILLEDYDGLERERRALLQDLSRSEAVTLGIDIRQEWPGSLALAELVEQGHPVQLLIDEIPMHAEEVPHWVTAFAVTTSRSGDVAMVVQDPWVDADHGETWVDADQLPISLDDIELMAQFGQPAYRGAIVLPN